MIDDDEDDTAWPDKPPSSCRAGSAAATRTFEAVLRRNQAGKWSEGIVFDPHSLRIVAHEPTPKAAPAAPLVNARVLAVNGVLVHGTPDLSFELAKIGKNAGGLLTLSQHAMVEAAYFSVGGVTGAPKPVLKKGVFQDDAVGKEGSLEESAVFWPPVVGAAVCPSPMPACLDYTPKEVRAEMDMVRATQRTQKKEAFAAQQEGLKKKAEDATEAGENIKATAQYVSNATKERLAAAVSYTKGKAGQKYMEKLLERAVSRFCERFPEVRDEEVVCNYKCLVRTHPPNVESHTDHDAHLFVTSRRVAFCSGGKANVQFRAWVPFTSIVGVHYGASEIDEKTYKHVHRTIDWMKEDPSSCDCLQIFTAQRQRFDILSIRAISLEKVKSVEGVNSTGGFLSYLDTAWREMQTVPVPGYEYFDGDDDDL